MMKNLAFVLLHYNNAKMTVDCVESILRLEGSQKASIVVVDNASPDKSGTELKEKYAANPQVDVVLNESNLGFAQGNNAGFLYAKKERGAEVIVVANNDILFEQKDFIPQLEAALQAADGEAIDVLGPDIRTVDGAHQSPLRGEPFSLKRVKKAIWIKRIFYWYFLVKKLLHLDAQIQILEKMFDAKSSETRADIAVEALQEGVVLQGACVIFANDYVANEDDAFVPDTFMYGEEDLLAQRCINKGYRAVYNPSLWLTHLDGKATEGIFAESIEKKLFIYKHTIHSLKVLKRSMT